MLVSSVGVITHEHPCFYQALLAVHPRGGAALLVHAQVKPGYLTTEFWLTVLTAVAASVLLGVGRIDATVWTAVIGGMSGGYSLSRGIAKTASDTTGTSDTTGG